MKKIFILTLIGILTFSLTGCNKTSNSEDSKVSTTSKETSNAETFIYDFLNKLKNGEDVSSYTTKENKTIVASENHISSSEFYFNGNELNKDILSFLLKDHKFSIMPLSNENELKEKHKATYEVKFEGKAWDSYFQMKGIKYMLSQKEYNSLPLSSTDTNQSLNFLKAIEKDIPIFNDYILVEVYELENSKGYAIDSLTLLDDLGIGNSYFNFMSSINDITSNKIIKPIDNSKLIENQKTMLNAIEEYNKMVENDSYDFNKIYNILLNLKNLPNEDDIKQKLKDIPSIIEWYNATDDSTKSSIHETLKNIGKIEYAIYGTYESNGEFVEPILAFLSQKPNSGNNYFNFQACSNVGCVIYSSNIFDGLVGCKDLFE